MHYKKGDFCVHYLHSNRYTFKPHLKLLKKLLPNRLGMLRVSNFLVSLINDGGAFMFRCRKWTYDDMFSVGGHCLR